jgi:hypothetical protein
MRFALNEHLRTPIRHLCGGCDVSRWGTADGQAALSSWDRLR